MSTSCLRPVFFAATFLASAVVLTAADSASPPQLVQRDVLFTAAMPAAGKVGEPVTFLGVAVGAVEPALAAQVRLPEGQGLIVTFVEPDGPAAQAGLQQYDVLTRLDDQILIEPRQLSVLVRHRQDGDRVALTFIRAGAETRATATLIRRALPTTASFQWQPSDATTWFEHKLVPGATRGVLRNLWERRVESPRENMEPGVPVPAAPAAPRIMIFRPQADVVISDAAGTLSVRADETGQVLTAKDPSGAVVFSGPIATDEQRAELPGDVRQRLEKLEQMDVFRTDAPRPVPATNLQPMPEHLRERGFVPSSEARATL